VLLASSLASSRLRRTIEGSQPITLLVFTYECNPPINATASDLSAKIMVIQLNPKFMHLNY
jgi:hypothetical protein